GQVLRVRRIVLLRQPIPYYRRFRAGRADAPIGIPSGATLGAVSSVPLRGSEANAFEIIPSLSGSRKHSVPQMFPIAIIGNRMEINWFPLWLSLRVALLATAFSLAAGVWIAYLLAIRRFRGKELVDAAVTLPLVLPPTVLGYYLLVLLSRESALGMLFEAITGGPLVF